MKSMISQIFGPSLFVWLLYIYILYIYYHTLYFCMARFCVLRISFIFRVKVCVRTFTRYAFCVCMYMHIYILGSTGSVQILFAYPRLVLTVEVIYCIFSCAYFVNVCILIIYTYLVCNFANMFTFDDVYIHIWYHFVYVIPALILKYMYIRLANFKKSLKDRLR